MKLAPARKFLALTTTCLKFAQKEKSNSQNNIRIIHETIYVCRGQGLQRPFFDDFGIGDLEGAHELGDEISQDSDENHDHGERDQYPISDGRVQHQIFRHGRKFTSFKLSQELTDFGSPLLFFLYFFALTPVSVLPRTSAVTI